MKKICFLSVFIPLLFSCSAFRSIKDNRENNFYIEVKQTVYGSYDQHSFIVSGEHMFIYKYYINKNRIQEKKRIFKKKIDQNSLDNIKRISTNLLSLKSEYIHAALGGIHWDIDIIINDEFKHIVVENTSVPEIDGIFDAINSIIPTRKPHIYKI